MRPVRLLVALILVLTVVTTVGCGETAKNAAQKAVEDKTGVTVDQDGDSVTVTSENGEVTASSSGKLPEGFPSDVVPVYEGSITGSMKSDEGYTVVIETDDAAPSVWEWYVNEFKDGWEIKQQVEVNRGGMISAEKGDWEVQVTVGNEGGDAKTAITTFAHARGGN